VRNAPEDDNLLDAEIELEGRFLCEEAA